MSINILAIFILQVSDRTRLEFKTENKDREKVNNRTGLEFRDQDSINLVQHYSQVHVPSVRGDDVDVDSSIDQLLLPEKKNKFQQHRVVGIVQPKLRKYWTSC